MKLINRKMEKHGSGTVKVKLEDDEDLWQLYNLVMIGDTVRASTWRKLQSTNTTGTVLTNKIRLTLTIRVTSIDFDPIGSLVRCSGVVAQENDHVKQGVHHTIAVTPVSSTMSGEVSIGKEYWDTVVFQRLLDACDSSKKADVAAVMMQEGLAHVCLITPSMTLLKQKIDVPIPRKRRSGATAHDKSLLRFYEAVFQSIVRHIDWSVVKCLLVCSPGFVNQDFLKYCMDEATRREMRDFLKTKDKWVLVPASSGHMHCLKEVMADKNIASKLTDTKATADVQCLDRFFKMMEVDQDRVAYGPLPVFAAGEKQAIEVLMVVDSLFRSQSIATRRAWVKLVEDVQDLGGDVHIFSSMHVTGEQLTNLCGCAALLRFPCPELNDLDSEEELDLKPSGQSHLYLDDLGDDDNDYM